MRGAPNTPQGSGNEAAAGAGGTSCTRRSCACRRAAGGRGRAGRTGVHHARHDVGPRFRDHFERHHAAVHHHHVPRLRVLGKGVVAGQRGEERIENKVGGGRRLRGHPPLACGPYLPACPNLHAAALPTTACSVPPVPKKLPAGAHLTEKQSAPQAAASRTVNVNSAPFSALRGLPRSHRCTSLPSVSICGAEATQESPRGAGHARACCSNSQRCR